MEDSRLRKTARSSSGANRLKSWHYVLLGVGALIGAVLAIYFLFPQITVEPARNYLRSQAKLEKKETTVGDHEITYLEGGKGETLVLVHGFASNKDSWALLARRLTSLFRVVALDLPGFGASTRSEEADYGYEKQVERLGAFVKALGLDEFHLGGHAMGAAIAALYATAHPDAVRTLLLIAPAGIRTPTPSEYEKVRKTGKEPLAVDSVEDLDRFLGYVFVSRPEIPGIVKRGLVVEAKENRGFYRTLGEKLLERDPAFLEPTLRKLEQPTLIVWCDRDRLIHPSGAAVADELVSESKLLMLQGCGHAPHSERPLPVSQTYYEFVNAASSDG